METTIGGDRLGSGNKQKAHLRNYERSTHDLSYIWRSSMSAGTLVPFMSEVALPGDSWDIDLQAEVMTLPTVGPLFGSFKVQLDIFEVPIRLYNPRLHMNLLNVGMDMSKITLPQVRVGALRTTSAATADKQIHPSCLFSYLNLRGIGRGITGQTGDLWRDVNAIPFLGYWTIYKQYYANKQEEYGVVIHNNMNFSTFATVSSALVLQPNFLDDLVINSASINPEDFSMNFDILLPSDQIGKYPKIKFEDYTIATNAGSYAIKDLFNIVFLAEENETNYVYRCGEPKVIGISQLNQLTDLKVYISEGSLLNNTPKLKQFDLEDIDKMQLNILSDILTPQYQILPTTQFEPYKSILYKGPYDYSVRSNQEGLGCKTYQSDLLNNWIQTEWIDGTNGISAVTSVSTTGNKFTIDSINLASKVYEMLNRIAISGGTYDDWLSAVYTHERVRGVESPVYHGSLIKELGFEEVISTAETKVDNNLNPSGTLSGRGRMLNKTKGGKVKIKVNEPSYIMGIVSLTPRIDYSQGNNWDVNLKTLNDLHKPALDAIGYQNLITDQMAWFDTQLNKVGTAYVPVYSSAGKQPAWINYMTNINRCRGQFAIEDKAMFMTLNRRYEVASGGGIKDVTTYIDPSKYNYIFAQTEISAENFWVQISNQITCRRKMSAKVIPNL
jgi:hypothetical protein